MTLAFEWDPLKAEANARKHGVSFAEAVTAFQDLRSLTIHDPDHSDREDRFALLGMTAQGRLVVVIHVARRDRLRLVSARRATRQEWLAYSGDR